MDLPNPLLRVANVADSYNSGPVRNSLVQEPAILKDFEEAGDYYRTAMAGKEFFRTPRPRWESLHALQGMVELYRITGDETFRTAFLNHWASMRRFEFRNTAGLQEHRGPQ